MAKSKIRIGVLTNSTVLPSWLFRTLDGFEDAEFYEIAFPPRARLNFWYYFLDALDRKLFSSKNRFDALVGVNADSLFAHSIAIDDIESSDLSLVINPWGSSLDLPSHSLSIGSWKLVMSATGRDDSLPVASIEILERHPVVKSYVEWTRPNGEIMVLDEAWTTNFTLSPLIVRNHVAWTGSQMLRKLLTHVVSDDISKIDEKKKLRTAVEIPARPPDFLDAIYLSVTYASRLLIAAVTGTFYWQQWILRFVIGETSTDPQKFRKIVAPHDEFWADPFIVSRDDKFFVFFEIWKRKRNLGHLAVLEIDREGNCTVPREILVRDYHLSYPHIVEQNGNLYMVPESKSAEAIQIYECVEFPTKWEFKMNLMENVKAVDTTLLFKDNTWWMFTCINEGYERSNENLYIFSSESLLSQHWQPHPMNPVTTDARAGRPGGAIYEEDGRLIRPVQNCSYTYGFGLLLYEIVKLDGKVFEQRLIESISPDKLPNSGGVHSIAKSDSITMIDSLEDFRRF